jgi:hypothetical protein
MEEKKSINDMRVGDYFADRDGNPIEIIAIEGDRVYPAPIGTIRSIIEKFIDGEITYISESK